MTTRKKINNALPKCNDIGAKQAPAKGEPEDSGLQGSRSRPELPLGVQGVEGEPLNSTIESLSTDESSRTHIKTWYVVISGTVLFSECVTVEDETGDEAVDRAKEDFQCDWERSELVDVIVHDVAEA